MEIRWGMAICTNYHTYGVGLAGANYTLYFRSLNSLASSNTEKRRNILNVPLFLMGTLSIRACYEVPFSKKVFNLEAFLIALPPPSLLT